MFQQPCLGFELCSGILHAPAPPLPDYVIAMPTDPWFNFRSTKFMAAEGFSGTCCTWPMLAQLYQAWFTHTLLTLTVINGAIYSIYELV